MDFITFTHKTPSGTEVTIKPTIIDTWSYFAQVNRLQRTGYMISTSNGTSYYVAFDEQGKEYGTPLAKRMLRTALKIYEMQK